MSAASVLATRVEIAPGPPLELHLASRELSTRDGTRLVVLGKGTLDLLLVLLAVPGGVSAEELFDATDSIDSKRQLLGQLTNRLARFEWPVYCERSADQIYSVRLAPRVCRVIGVHEARSKLGGDPGGKTLAADAPRILALHARGIKLTAIAAQLRLPYAQVSSVIGRRS